MLIFLRFCKRTTPNQQGFWGRGEMSIVHNLTLTLQRWCFHDSNLYSYFFVFVLTLKLRDWKGQMTDVQRQCWPIYRRRILSPPNLSPLPSPPIWTVTVKPHQHLILIFFIKTIRQKAICETRGGKRMRIGGERIILLVYLIIMYIYPIVLYSVLSTR